LAQASWLIGGLRLQDVGERARCASLRLSMPDLLSDSGLFRTFFFHALLGLSFL